MAISPLTSGFPLASPAVSAPLGKMGVSPAGIPEAGEAKDFTNLVQGLIEKANQPHLDADAALKDLVTGKTNNVHDVVLSAVKADMSFRMVLELRNRLSDAYQEIMRMQV